MSAVADEHVGNLSHAVAGLDETTNGAVSAINQVGLPSRDHQTGRLRTGQSYAGAALCAEEDQRRLVGDVSGCRRCRAASARATALIERSDRFLTDQMVGARSRQDTSHRLQPRPSSGRFFPTRTSLHSTPSVTHR